MTSTDGWVRVRVEFCDHGIHGGAPCPLDVLPARYVYDPVDQTVLASPAVSNDRLTTAVHADLPVFAPAELGRAVEAARWVLLMTGELAGVDVTCELPVLTRERLAAVEGRTLVRDRVAPPPVEPVVLPPSRPSVHRSRPRWWTRWRRLGAGTTVPLIIGGMVCAGVLLPTYSTPEILGRTPYTGPTLTVPRESTGQVAPRTENVADTQPAEPSGTWPDASPSVRPRPSVSPSPPSATPSTPAPTTATVTTVPPATSPSVATVPTPEPTPVPDATTPPPEPTLSPTCVPNPAGKGCDRG